jgi:hypothetical protein
MHRPTPSRTIPFAVFVALAMMSAHGAAPAGPTDLRRVDQSRADIGPLSTSTRSLPPDLRDESDFRTVYQIPKDANSPYAGWYVRRGGGVWALFPRSQYTPLDPQETGVAGSRAVIPANTHFILGSSPLANLGESRPASQSESLAVPSPDAGIVDTRWPNPQLYVSLNQVPEPSTRLATELRSGGSYSAVGGSGDGASAIESIDPAELRLRRLTESVSRLFDDTSFRDQRVARLLRLATTPAMSAPSPSRESQATPRAADEGLSRPRSTVQPVAPSLLPAGKPVPITAP